MAEGDRAIEDLWFVEAGKRQLPQYQHFGRALQHFLATAPAQGVAVLLCGSFATGRLRPGSDLDVLVVLPPGSDEREDFREVDSLGVRVQVFRATEAEVLGSFDWERQSLSRQRSSLVAHAVVVLGDPTIGERLITLAQQAWSAPVPPLDLANARSLLNFIENQFPAAMEKLFAASPHGFLMTWNGMMEKYFTVVHQLEGKLLPRHEDIDGTLSSIDDVELGTAFARALAEPGLLERKRLFFELSALIQARLQQRLAPAAP